MFGADEKLRGEGRRFSQLESSTIYDYESCQFAGFIIGAGFSLRRRQKNGGNKHSQTGDGWNKAGPKTKRENHQSRPGDSQENAKERAVTGIAPRVQNPWDEQHESEENSDSKMMEPLAKTLWRRNRWIGSAHLWSFDGSFKADLSWLQATNFAHAGESTAHMRNGDGAADDQRHIESVDHFIALPAFFAAANQMIGDAIVATQNGGGDQPEQFLRFGAERAGFVGLVVKSEEALDAEMAAAKDFLIQVGAKFLKVFQAIGHDSSGDKFTRTNLARYYGPTAAIPSGRDLGRVIYGYGV